MIGSGIYSRSQKVGTSLSSFPEGKVEGILALIILNPCSNFLGFTVGGCGLVLGPAVQLQQVSSGLMIIGIPLLS